MAGATTRTVNWAVEVASRLKGAHFPIEKDEARERLEGLEVKGRAINEILEGMTFPIPTPADLLHQVSASLS